MRIPFSVSQLGECFLVEHLGEGAKISYCGYVASEIPRMFGVDRLEAPAFYLWCLNLRRTIRRAESVAIR